MRRFLPAFVLMAAIGLEAGAAAPTAVERPSGKSTQPRKETQAGLASYYGPGLQGRRTASGETFDKNDMVAAHPTHPLGTRARVTNLRNGRSQEVRIIDRGPASEHQRRGVIIDVSEAVAKKLEFRKQGKTRVRVHVLEWGDSDDRKPSARASAD